MYFFLNSLQESYDLILHNTVFSYHVWPALALIGGIDSGLRMGGRCRDKLSSRHGTVLGVSKRGSKSVKVQWDDGDNLHRLYLTV